MRFAHLALCEPGVRLNRQHLDPEEPSAGTPFYTPLKRHVFGKICRGPSDANGLKMDCSWAMVFDHIGAGRAPVEFAANFLAGSRACPTVLRRDPYGCHWKFDEGRYWLDHKISKDST
ncbi:predicted protein [Histoplasma capsulatum var. duboisii H88]|uniref:Predicted protein n=1 Tax=Ajellomyces capsulatus (strain H88) TaxID=544711 RepID=F0UJ67_AJEC8|nr:predicted protein [Histoplasma capsulatum var. duboisii H88]